MAWRLPGFVAVRDTAVRQAFDNLSKWLVYPKFDRIELGGGRAAVDAGTGLPTVARGGVLTGDIGFTPYTPVLSSTGTQPSLGSNGSFAQDGQYAVFDNVVFWQAFLRFGTTAPGAGTGSYSVSMPVDAEQTAHGGLVQPVTTHVRLFESGGANYYGNAIGQVNGTTANKCDLFYQATFNGAAAAVTNALPWAWAASDAIIVSGWYKAA